MTLTVGVADIAFPRSIAQGAGVSMPELPLLSIVVVAYRSREEIADCLASIPSTMHGRAVEVTVVDNSPGDGAGELIRARFPRVDYVPTPENLGFGRANNLGYRRGRGEYVLFLNPDTVLHPPPSAEAAAPDALAHCLHRLEQEPAIGLISPRLLQADGTLDLACRRSIPTLWDGFCRATGLAARFPRTSLFSGYNLTHLPEAGTYDVGAINGAFMLGARRVFEAVSASGAVFDERFFMYGDDLDLCVRVTRAGYRIVYDGRVAITHLKGMSVARDFDRMSRAIFDANRDVYLKHFGGSALARWKYRFAFGAWKRVALLRARWRGHRRVRPV